MASPQVRRFWVTKATGETVPYRRERLVESLVRAGAPEEIAQDVARTLEQRITPGMSTQKILQLARALLRRRAQASALRYDLKRAILRLGPTGFPFEKYIAALLKNYGYAVKTNQIIPGACVNHEVDVVAQKDGEHFLVEAKYHNQPGLRSDVKVALYTWARFQDIRKAQTANQRGGSEFYQPWLVTNTKCTSDAIRYGECVGLKIVSWRYPTSGGLEQLIEQKRLYPITILPLATSDVKTKLVQANIMLAKDLLAADLPRLAREYLLPLAYLKRLKAAAERIC